MDSSSREDDCVRKFKPGTLTDKNSLFTDGLIDFDKLEVLEDSSAARNDFGCLRSDEELEPNDSRNRGFFIALKLLDGFLHAIAVFHQDVGVEKGFQLR
jgi:hypothetical protein